MTILRLVLCSDPVPCLSDIHVSEENPEKDVSEHGHEAYGLQTGPRWSWTKQPMYSSRVSTGSINPHNYWNHGCVDITGNPGIRVTSTNLQANLDSW